MKFKFIPRLLHPQLMVSVQSRRDNYKSAFNSDFFTNSFSSALFPALICTHLYNLFYFTVQMGREVSWQGALLIRTAFVWTSKLFSFDQCTATRRQWKAQAELKKTISSFFSSSLDKSLESEDQSGEGVTRESVTDKKHTLPIVGSYDADNKDVFAQCCASGTDLTRSHLSISCINCFFLSGFVHSLMYISNLLPNSEQLQKKRADMPFTTLKMAISKG